MFKKKNKEKNFPPLYVFKTSSVLEDSEVHKIAVYNVFSTLQPVEESFKNTNLWNQFKFIVALVIHPINTIRVLLAIHASELSEQIQVEYLRLKSNQRPTEL